MKRRLALLLLICVYLAATGAGARGEYALTPEAIPEGCEAFNLCSMSPNGHTLVFSDRINGEVLLVDRATGARTKVFADYENSVEDTYGNLETAVKRMYMAIREAKSLVWSPDGRYIAFTSWKDAMQNMRNIYDLIVIDARTGAARLYQTYANNISSQNPEYIGVIASNCFSADSAYLYSVRYTNEVNSRTMLMRLDMETGECEDLIEFGYEGRNGRAACDLKDLAITQTGALVGALDTQRASMLKGIYVAKQNIFDWQAKAYYVNTSDDRARVLAPWRVFASTRTEYGIAQYKIQSYGYVAISVFNCMNDFEGFDKPLWISGLESGTAKRVSADEIIKSVTVPPVTDTFLVSLDILGTAVIYTCAPSPDGTRAILLASYQESIRDIKKHALLMLNLETLEYEPIATEEITYMGAQYMYNDTMWSAQFSGGIEWLSDEYVLMNTKDNGCQLYRLTSTGV